jgi:hypothetical protein
MGPMESIGDKMRRTVVIIKKNSGLFVFPFTITALNDGTHALNTTTLASDYVAKIAVNGVDIVAYTDTGEVQNNVYYVDNETLIDGSNNEIALILHNLLDKTITYNYSLYYEIVITFRLADITHYRGINVLNEADFTLPLDLSIAEMQPHGKGIAIDWPVIHGSNSDVIVPLFNTGDFNAHDTTVNHIIAPSGLYINPNIASYIDIGTINRGNWQRSVALNIRPNATFEDGVQYNLSPFASEIGDCWLYLKPSRGNDLQVNRPYNQTVVGPSGFFAYSMFGYRMKCNLFNYSTNWEIENNAWFSFQVHNPEIGFNLGYCYPISVTMAIFSENGTLMQTFLAENVKELRIRDGSHSVLGFWVTQAQHDNYIMPYNGFNPGYFLDVYQIEYGG